MQTILIILIIVFGIIPLLRIVWQRWVQPWLLRRAANKMEDYLRAATGMPPREETRSRKTSSRQSSRENSGGRRTAHSAYQSSGPLIPREYAVDVEFVETKEYSATVEITGEESGGHHKGRRSASRVTIESQVSDVEYTEIKIR